MTLPSLTTRTPEDILVRLANSKALILDSATQFTNQVTKQHMNYINQKGVFFHTFPTVKSRVFEKFLRPHEAENETGVSYGVTK